MKRLLFLLAACCLLLCAALAAAEDQWVTAYDLEILDGVIRMDWSAHAAGHSGNYRLYWRYADNPAPEFAGCDPGQTEAEIIATPDAVTDIALAFTIGTGDFPAWDPEAVPVSVREELCSFCPMGRSCFPRIPCRATI